MRLRATQKYHDRSKDGPMPQFKLCSDCGRMLETNYTYFSPSKYHKWGLLGVCRDCIKRQRRVRDDERRLYERKAGLRMFQRAMQQTTNKGESNASKIGQ